MFLLFEMSGAPLKFIYYESESDTQVEWINRLLAHSWQFVEIIEKWYGWYW